MFRFNMKLNDLSVMWLYFRLVAESYLFRDFEIISCNINARQRLNPLGV